MADRHDIDRQGDRARCLIVPGLGGSGPDHWQTIWERERSDCARVDMGCWADPDPRAWVERLDASVCAQRRGAIVLVAHSLGCQAVAWWSRLFGSGHKRRIVGALLVAPPDVERSDDPRIQRFAPMPSRPLPFPAIVVASTNDPYASMDRSLRMASRLGAELIDIGPAGHINASSKLGAWPEGQKLIAPFITATANHG